MCHHDNPCSNCQPGASCCVCTTPLPTPNLASVLPLRLRGGASAASSPGSASDKGSTDSDSDDNENIARENTSLRPAEWPESPVQTSQPLAESELVAPAEEVETSQPALEAPMPRPKTPPNLSRLLEDIARTPTPQRTTRSNYAYPAPRESGKSKAARRRNRDISWDRQPDSGDLPSLPPSAPVSHVPSRGAPENVYQGFIDRNADVFRDSSPYPTDVPPTVPVLLSNVYARVNPSLEVIPNPMQAQDVHHLHLYNLENAFDRLGTTVQSSKDGTAITARSASGPDEKYEITEHEAAVSTVMLLGSKGINWLNFGSFMDTVSTLSPFKGSLQDFKSFWQNVIEEACANDDLRPFVNKYCPDTHKDLRTQAKLWKERHDRAAHQVNDHLRRQNDLEADIACLRTQLADSNTALLRAQQAESAALDNARNLHDRLQTTTANFEESRRTDQATIDNLRGQLAQAQHAVAPNTSDELRERYLALLNSHPAPQNAVDLLPPLFRQSFTNLLAANGPAVSATPSPPAPARTTAKPQFPLDITYRGQTAAPSKKRTKKPLTTPQEEAQIIAKLTSTVNDAWPTLPQQDAITMAIRMKDTAKSRLGKGTTLAASSTPSSSPPKVLTFRQKETNRGSVRKPGSRGTNEAELHMAVPHSVYTAGIFSAHGTDLLNKIADIVRPNLSDEAMSAFDANPAVAARWSTKDNLILRFHGPVTDLMRNAIVGSLQPIPSAPSSTSSSDSIQVLNKPPTTCLKFMAVATTNSDGTEVTPTQLLEDIRAHPAWAEVPVWGLPRFVARKDEPLRPAHIVTISVQDNGSGAIGKSLMGTSVRFSSCGFRTCLRWVDKDVVPMCSQCQQWGHYARLCRTNRIVCSKCGGNHTLRSHQIYCPMCSKGDGHLCAPKCPNCSGCHASTNIACPFWIARFNRDAIHDLTKKRRDELLASKSDAAARPPAGQPRAPLRPKAPRGRQPSRPNLDVNPNRLGGMRSDGGKIVSTKPVPMNAFRALPPPPPSKTVDPALSYSQAASSQDAAMKDPQLGDASSGLDDAYI